MIFKDSIEIMEADFYEDEYGEPVYGDPVVVATVPAQVDVERTTLDTAGGSQFQSVTQLVAYCKPFDYNQRTQTIWWRGQKYAPNGPMLERTIQGRVHHIELPLQLVEG